MYQTLATAMTDAANDAEIIQLEKGTIMENNTVENEQNDNLTAQLQGALDQSATAFMLIDRDFYITYANQETLSLLKEHEATFANKWPGFKADINSLLSANIDDFHSNPAHQHKLLSDPSNLPYKTDIQIAHLSFELNVSAILAASGDYIGNALEWMDVTGSRAKSVEVGRLTSAVEGMT
ncbi:MAG: hypothetical protein GY928_27190 [Colwellia sp.]|nr:hypothetical protein [Colwellia sp.]